jgi:hypothetical protein
MVAQITVSGLRELQRELRAVDRKLPRELTKAHRDAAQIVLDPAQRGMASQPIPHADEAAAGLKIRAAQRSISIALLASNPVVRAAEFGTIVHSVFGRKVLAASMKRRVFRPWRGNDDDAGYALYPTIRRVVPTPQFQDAYLEALDRVYAAAFPGRF